MTFKWTFKLIWHNSFDFTLEEIEERKPDACALSVTLIERSMIGESVVVKEEPCGDIEGNEDINGVVFVSCKDKEDSKEIQDPRDSVNEVQVWRCICDGEKN